MKVEMLHDALGKKKGDAIEVEDAIAEKWIRAGFVREISERKSKREE